MKSMRPRADTVQANSTIVKLILYKRTSKRLVSPVPMNIPNTVGTHQTSTVNPETKQKQVRQ